MSEESWWVHLIHAGFSTSQPATLSVALCVSVSEADSVYSRDSTEETEEGEPSGFSFWIYNEFVVFLVRTESKASVCERAALWNPFLSQP